MTEIQEIVSREKENLNIHEYFFIKPSVVIFSDEVRMFCEKNGCGMYGTSWACPPAIGSIEECKKMCNSFKNVFVFSTVTKIKKKYDMDEWLKARKVHEAITDKVAEVFRTKFKKTLILSTEGCTICKKCTYPEKPCRFPDRMYPAIESFGIMVIQLAPVCNIKYNNGLDTITYFSMVFF